ncbi:hypothetical protein NE237_012446 [Protea cynaroides]|uniref:AAA+ ATPase domain-containing protein n=1 Tax=Protea cynaroides TaxID=273540 RepID=A0A9Q0GXH7_9MAGN|nr:hypothetical protein NE237_012446 [Protea cynaroides]
MDCVGSVVDVINTYLFAPLVEQVSYLRSSGANVNDLQTAVRRLMARRNDEQSNLKAAENAGQVKTDIANNWFEEIEAIKTEFDALENKYSQGTYMNCWLLYNLSKRSVELKQMASDLLNEQFDLVRRPFPKSVIEIECESIENQQSTQHMLQQMLDCIDDPEIGIIGLYGMGGVGKTTLAGKVNNHFKKNFCFETVIMVTVSAIPNIPSIRTSIGKRFGLDLSNDNEDDARELLLDALRKNKFLLILDDLWSKLELKDVGIPHPRNHKGSKILVTSRIQDVCTDMDARKTIKLRPLSIDESWNLFVEKSGQHVTADHIKRSAEKIVGKCKGLPLAIVTVARAMANRHGIGEWENAAREMEQSATELRGMKEEVLVPLKFSFDRLENDMLRSLFLYCGCFPEDYNIEKEGMLNFCVGEGLVNKIGSLTTARNKGEALIGSLKTACMLEDGEDEDSVKMHDMMRELALWITSPESDCSSKFLIKAGQSFKDAPEANQWLNATRISLMDTKIKELPELRERCPKLTTLLLRHSKMIHTIPPTNFFQYMDHLSVLDLFDTQTLECLPDSLSCLVNLRVLSLRRCKRFRSLPALEMLQQLQVLDLYGCLSLDQQILGSKCMGTISNLRYLDVSLTKVSFSRGVISHLLKMEDLRLYNAHNIRWRVSSENEKWDDQGNINNIDVGELSHLTNLTSLDICFKDIKISNWFKPLAKKIRVLILQRCRDIKQEAIRALNESQNLQFLSIQECSGLTYAPTCLKGRLEIWNCTNLEKMLDGAEEKTNQDSFQRLESLDLKGLLILERICVGLAPLKCFGNLNKISIFKCKKLKMVFTKGMPRFFNNLKSIAVESCDRMEVIMETEEEDGKLEGSNNDRVISAFPKLEKLTLLHLPLLVEAHNNHIWHCPILKEMNVDNCPRLEKDPLRIQTVHGLQVINGTEGMPKSRMKRKFKRFKSNEGEGSTH